MELGIEIIFRISIIYILITVGYIIRTQLRDPNNSKLISYLTKIILYFFFPFLILSSILNAQIPNQNILLITIIFCLVVMFSAFFALKFYSKTKSIPDTTLGSMYLAVTFPNSVFLPFPLILLLIGPSGLISATLFAVTIIIVQNSLGSYIGINYGTPENLESISFHKNSLRIMKKILLFPPAFSMIVAFLIKWIFDIQNIEQLINLLPLIDLDVNLASNLINTVNWVSLIFALILVGITFDFSYLKSKDHEKSHYLVQTTIFRLIIPPAAGLLCLILLYALLHDNSVFSEDTIIPIIIQAISGPAVINIAFSKQFNLNVGFVSLYITVITIISLIITPFIILFSLLII